MARVVFLACLSCACGAIASSDDVVRSSTPRDTAATVDASVVTGIDTFAVAALRDRIARQPADNIVFSPYSIESALAMVLAGARGDTATQIQTVLSLPMGYPDVGASFDAIDLSLASRAADVGQGFVVRTSNGLWGQRGFVWEAPFLDVLATDFGAGVHPTDFTVAPDTSRIVINAWVSTNTDGLLPQLLAAGSITANTRFVLVDAMALHARWFSPFQDAGTSTFNLADGTTSPIAMMRQTSGGTYTSTADYDAVTLPFDDPSASTYGASASVTLIVPATWDGFDAKLDFQQMRGGGDYQLDLTMPKFSIDGDSVSFKDTLVALGMPLAFTDGADFSGMTTSANLELDDVVHQARIDVDEQGVTASAGTAAIGGAADLPPHATLVIDRPFYFAVTDDASGAVMFAGRFVHP